MTIRVAAHGGDIDYIDSNCFTFKMWELIFMKTKILYISASLLVVCAVICGGMYLHKKLINDTYKSAISLIQNGAYKEAIEELEKTNQGNLNREVFRDNNMKHLAPDAYKNSIPLYAYALAQLEYNEEDAYLRTVNEYLEHISDDYSGELSGEIETFKWNFKPQYDEFLAEERRKSEELQRLLEESKREYYERLGTKIPYEGLSEDDINRTVMGKYHKKDTSSQYGYTDYYWKTNFGEIMLIATCKEGKVISVSRYGWDYFWTKDMQPIWNAKKTYTNKKSSSDTKKKDPYNVNDYSDPEDFYYDNYDDFWDYEDAEDYYYDNYED